MDLSYPARVACWTLFSLALLRFMFALAAALATRALCGSIFAQSARWQERYHFLAAALPDVAAVIFTLSIAVPSYYAQESSITPEHVGWLPILIASITVARYGRILCRGVQLASRMHLGGGSNHGSLDGKTPQPHGAVLAVSGLLRTRIVASSHVTQGKLFPSDVLAVALAHEESHIRQRDNLKLFLLSSLAGAGAYGVSVQRWRSLAEQAADDDAIAEGPGRAILLAEALVTAARAVSESTQAALAMQLMPFEMELESRVHRLLNHTRRTVPRGRNNALYCLLSALAVAQCSVCILVATSHEFVEFIFHLG